MKTLKEFCLNEGVSSISNIRENTNGLKFCTFIINGESTNIYFSKRATSKVQVGQTAKAISEMFITLVEYEDQRDSRYKISVGSDEFISVKDLF